MVRIHDSLAKRAVELTTRVPGRVSMYVCGPTVYDVPHVGHGRTALVYDVIRRYLEWHGNVVTFVGNVTNVEDKIIARAAAEGVYFSVSSYAHYGELSGRRLDDLLENAGARVEIDEQKRSPVDFALWKAAKPGEPDWDSPWGRGRPGWHIECSAMSLEILGESFDLHGGGDDLIFPHHENERAQAEGAGHEFARHWIHSGMVMVGREKMSKSLGNFTNLSEALDRHGPRAFRLLALQTHYRRQLEMGDKELSEAGKAVDRLDALFRRASIAGVKE